MQFFTWFIFVGLSVLVPVRKTPTKHNARVNSCGWGCLGLEWVTVTNAADLGLIYDPVWSRLCQRAFCVPLLASRVRTEHQPSFSACHPFFNDGTQWSAQCQRSSLNNIITWPRKEKMRITVGSAFSYSLHSWSPETVVGQNILVIELTRSVRHWSFSLLLSVL